MRVYCSTGSTASDLHSGIGDKLTGNAHKWRQFTCSMAWRRLSQLARSVSTITPSQSSTRCVNGGRRTLRSCTAVAANAAAPCKLAIVMCLQRAAAIVTIGSDWYLYPAAASQVART